MRCSLKQILIQYNTTHPQLIPNHVNFDFFKDFVRLEPSGTKSLWQTIVKRVSRVHRPTNITSRWIRLTHVTFACEVIRCHLFQVWKNLKTFFSGWRTIITSLYLFCFRFSFPSYFLSLSKQKSRIVNCKTSARFTSGCIELPRCIPSWLTIQC